MDNSSLRSLDDVRIRRAMAARLHHRSEASGQITLPAVPALIDEYVSLCDKIFTAIGRRFTTEQLLSARQVIQEQLDGAYAASQRSSIVISFDAPTGAMLNYHVKPGWSTIEEAYEGWVATQEPPPLGTGPDARVWALAAEATDAATHWVLEIGARTGRNALALARRGHPVDVVEPTPKFADLIRAQAERESLGIRVIQNDVSSNAAELRRDYQLILLSEVVSDFRSTQQLRGVFELAAQCLGPGGRLVFNAFLPRNGYIPDDAARQLGQQTYTSIFTRDEMSTATAGLPLELVADDSVYDYEKAHLADGAWPPTGWYAEWVSGLDVFDVERDECPIEMRWLVYRKTQ